MASWSQHEVDVNGISIHYSQTGESDLPKLILAHGFSDNGLCFARTAEQLQSNFTVIMFDARNHGLSSRSEASAEAMVEDLRALIELLTQADGTKPFLLGHSMGASTVAGVVAMYPELVQKAVLEDPPWTIAGEVEKSAEERAAENSKRSKGFKYYLDSLAKQSDTELLAFAKETYPDWHDDDLPAWVDSKRQIDIGAMNGLRLTGWRETAKAIGVPTLLIHSDGSRDGLLTGKVASQLCEANAHLTSAEIPNAGHNTRRENFADYIAAVKDYLV